MNGEPNSTYSCSELLLSLTKILEAKDAYTFDHSEQIVGWAETLAWKLGCRSCDLDSIHWAALLHDIGKIGIPDSVLQKPTGLNNEEWQMMKQHSQIGADIVGSFRQMKNVSRLIKYHHEHYDGSGYPEGLIGEEIPLGARILAVVDAYSAMITDRVYRSARQPEEACEELERTSGTQFDPKVVDIFLQIVNSTDIVDNSLIAA
jgi:putative nucleotidyltransferase with HDIG domain